jgi:mannose-6-phosphate isomerase-like protein (cupin superfamily)
MTGPILVPSLAGSVLGLPDGDFVIAEWKDDGCPPEGPMPVAPLHLHRQCDEAWYVLEGTLCVQRGEEILTVPAGAAAFVPKGTPHTYWNPDPTPARYLLIMTSRTHRLIQAIHAAQDRGTEAMRRLFELHDAQLL